MKGELQKCLCMLSIIVLRKKENGNQPRSESAGQTFKKLAAVRPYIDIIYHRWTIKV